MYKYIYIYLYIYQYTSKIFSHLVIVGIFNIYIHRYNDRVICRHDLLAMLRIRFMVE